MAGKVNNLLTFNILFIALLLISLLIEQQSLESVVYAASPIVDMIPTLNSVPMVPQKDNESVQSNKNQNDINNTNLTNSYTASQKAEISNKDNDNNKKFIKDDNKNTNLQGESIIKFGYLDGNPSHYKIVSLGCSYLNHQHRDEGLFCRPVRYSEVEKLFQDLKNNEIDFILTESNIESQAVYGKGVFKEKFEQLRSILNFENEILSIIVRARGIRSLQDLKSKIVYVGKYSGSSYILLNKLLENSSITLDTINLITDNSNKIENDSKDYIYSLCNNKIDALAMVTKHPNQQILALSRLCDIDIIDLQEEQEKIINTDEYAPDEVQGGVYFGVPFDIKSIGTQLVILTTKDVEGSKVLMLRDAVLSYVKAFEDNDPIFYNTKLEDMIEGSKISALHPSIQSDRKKSKEQ